MTGKRLIMYRLSFNTYFDPSLDLFLLLLIIVIPFTYWKSFYLLMSGDRHDCIFIACIAIPLSIT